MWGSMQQFTPKLAFVHEEWSILMKKEVFLSWPINSDHNNCCSWPHRSCLCNIPNSKQQSRQPGKFTWPWHSRSQGHWRLFVFTLDFSFGSRQKPPGIHKYKVSWTTASQIYFFTQEHRAVLKTSNQHLYFKRHLDLSYRTEQRLILSSLWQC